MQALSLQFAWLQPLPERFAAEAFLPLLMSAIKDADPEALVDSTSSPGSGAWLTRWSLRQAAGPSDDHCIRMATLWTAAGLGHRRAAAMLAHEISFARAVMARGNHAVQADRRMVDASVAAFAMAASPWRAERLASALRAYTTARLASCAEATVPPGETRVISGHDLPAQHVTWAWLMPPLPPEACQGQLERLLDFTKARVGTVLDPELLKLDADAATVAWRISRALWPLSVDDADLEDVRCAYTRLAASAGCEAARLHLLFRLAREVELTEIHEQGYGGVDPDVMIDCLWLWLLTPLELALDQQRRRSLVFDAGRIAKHVLTKAIDSVSDSNDDGDGDDGKLRSPAVPKGFVPLKQYFKAEEAKEVQPIAESKPTGPSVLVLQQVGDATSKDGRELQYRFKGIVGKRVPLVGSVPAPGLLERRILERWPWAETVARFIEGHAALLRLGGREWVKLPSLLLVGKPGSGKTTLLEWLGRELAIPVLTVPIGGTSDAAGLQATPRQWSSSHPCAPARLIADSHSANPLIILDEIEKGAKGGGHNGSAVGAALTMVTGPTAFYDSCLQANLDLSCVNWAATANSLASVHPAFLDRFTVLELGQPGAEDFDALLASVLERLAANLGIPMTALPQLSPGGRDWLRSAWLDSARSIRVLSRLTAAYVADLTREVESVQGCPQ